MTKKKRLTQIPIPTDWNQEDGYNLWVFCVPKSRQWNSVIKGALSTLEWARNWDSNTGNVVNARNTATEIIESINMTCLDELASAIRYLADKQSASCASCGSNTCHCPENTGTEFDRDPESEPGTFGPGETWDDYQDYQDDKCIAANVMYEHFEKMLGQLKDFNVDTLFAGGATLSVGIVATIIAAYFATAPIGIVVGVVSGIIALLAGPATFSLSDLHARVVAEKSALICVLYDATNATTAQTDFRSTIDNGSLTLLEVGTMNLLTPITFFNQLMSPTAPLLAEPIDSFDDCSNCAAVCDLYFADKGTITVQTPTEVQVTADSGTGTGQVDIWFNTDGTISPFRAICAPNVTFESIVLTTGVAGVDLYDDAQVLIATYHTDPANMNLPQQTAGVRHITVNWNTGQGVGATAGISITQ